MKYKIYLEAELYEEFDVNIEPDREIECVPDLLDYELQEICKYIYYNCDGWEWMKDSNERILAIDETGKISYFVFEIDYEPVFYVSESKTKE